MKRIFFGIWILLFIASVAETENDLKSNLLIAGIAACSGIVALAICLIISGMKKIIEKM